MGMHLPPLTSVRAFEAAARNGSVTHAADELCVTPAAVTHQVRTLERWLGTKLFSRQGSVLSLTPAGQSFYLGANRGIDAIRTAAQQISAQESARLMTISAPPSFTSQWLVPRLSNFQKLHNTALSVSIRLPGSENAWQQDDIGIISGHPTPGFLHRKPLLKYRIIAVCSPRLLDGPNPIRSLADLQHHPLLHDESLRTVDGVSWQHWLQRVGAEFACPENTIRFTNAFAAYRFAADGHGVVLAKDVLVRDELARGTLVSPFNLSLPSVHTYDFYCGQGRVQTRAVQRFWDWLLEEAVAGGFDLADNATDPLAA